MILLDSTVLIEYFRSKRKNETIYYKISGKYEDFAISSVTHFEIFCGSNDNQDFFWNSLLEKTKIIQFDHVCATKAAEIYKSLRQNNIRLELADLFIGATAITHQIPIATLNEKHFNLITGLQLITK